MRARVHAREMLTSRQSFHNQRVSFSHAISSLMPFLGASAFAPPLLSESARKHATKAFFSSSYQSSSARALSTPGFSSS